MSDNQRARLGPSNDSIEALLGPNVESNLLQPLLTTRGILFPYTPQVMIIRTANYDDFHFTHSNYKYYQFKNSSPAEIQITADFTVQTNAEGRYLLAVLQFLKSMTMMEFGLKTDPKLRGTPPPTLRFNYLGPHMLSNIPVVVGSVTYDLNKDVDYVPVQLPAEISKEASKLQRQNILRTLGSRVPTSEEVEILSSGFKNDEQDNLVYLPTKLLLTIQLFVQQNPKDLRENFNLTKFKSGQLLNKGYL